MTSSGISLPATDDELSAHAQRLIGPALRLNILQMTASDSAATDTQYRVGASN
jgi:hypothetical protein